MCFRGLDAEERLPRCVRVRRLRAAPSEAGSLSQKDGLPEIEGTGLDAEERLPLRRELAPVRRLVTEGEKSFRN